VGEEEERDVERTFLNGPVCFVCFFFKDFSFFLFPFGWVCKCIGGGWWGHQKLYNSPVMLVVMASLLHMNNCRIHVVYVQLISVRVLV